MICRRYGPALSTGMMLPAALLLFGCPAADRAASGSGAIDGGADVEVELVIKSWPEIEDFIATKKGQVVVVDLWSTSCEPCMQEFPGLVALHRKYPQVACISVSTDYYGDPTEPPDSFHPAALSFLEEQQATFDNFLSSDDTDTLMQRVDAFAVPVVLVYDADGSLQKRFSNDDQEYGEEGFTYKAHIEPLVAKLTGQSG